MNQKFHGFLILGLLLSCSTLFAAGKSGLSFLKIGAGARAAALGEAFVAVPNASSASLFWNPAGMVWTDKAQAHATYNQWIQDVDHQLASITWPTKSGAFGLSTIFTSIGGIERRTTATEQPEGEISANDFTIGLAYARKFDQYAVGIHVKYLYEKIYLETAYGFAADFGVQTALGVPGLFAGLAVQNLGYTTELVNEKIDLPTTIRAGAFYRLPKEIGVSRFAFTTDFVKIVNQESHLQLGLEVTIGPMILARAGWMTGYDERTWSAGFGLVLGPVLMDFAFVPFDSDLGSSQQFSFLYYF